MQGKDWLIRRTKPFAAAQRAAGRGSLGSRYLSQLPLSAPSLAIAGLGLAGYASNFSFPIQPRRNARSGDYHECARRRFRQSACFR
jgi:hypothetical protein